jgi:hypothetical protein
MDIDDGAWCCFNEPRALTTEDVTIVGWVGRDGDIRVASYNNETGVVVKRTLHQQLHVDDHANPAFYLRQGRRLRRGRWSGGSAAASSSTKLETADPLGLGSKQPQPGA